MDGARDTIVEPERLLERLAVVHDDHWRFPRGWLHDSGALAPFAFAIVALAGMAICAYVGVRSRWIMPLMIVTAVCALLFVGLTCLSLGVYRRHAAEPMRRDLFAMGGVLFSISWMDDGKAYGSSGKGIVRIHAIPLDRVRAYRNKEDRTVWILPQHAGDLRDIWRRGHRWEERRELCRKLLARGMRSTGETDPFFGVHTEFEDFFTALGVSIEDTDQPVDFLAGTAHGVLADDPE